MMEALKNGVPSYNVYRENGAFRHSENNVD